MKQPEIDVVGFGAMNWDRLSRFDQLPDWDNAFEDGWGWRELIVVPTDTEEAAGGSAANTTYGVGKLGLRAGFVGAVGDGDEEGLSMLDSFREAGVDISGVVVKDNSSTGNTHCSTYPDGQRQILISPGANNQFTAEDMEATLEGALSRANMVHVTSFVDDEQFHLQRDLFSRLPDSTQISFSPGAVYTRRGFNQLELMLQNSDYLFLNDAELAELTGYRESHFDMSAEGLLGEFPRCKAVIVTLGSGKKRDEVVQLSLVNPLNYLGLSREPRTSIVFGRDEVVEMPVWPLPGDFIDSVGAGDSFAAGFLYGVVKRRSLADSTVLGSLTSQFCVMAQGARAGLPTSGQLESRLRQQQQDGSLKPIEVRPRI